MPNMERESLIADIKACSERTGWAPSTICLRGAKNGKLYARLQDGRSCSITVAETLRSYMASLTRKNAVLNSPQTPAQDVAKGRAQ